MLLQLTEIGRAFLHVPLVPATLSSFAIFRMSANLPEPSSSQHLHGTLDDRKKPHFPRLQYALACAEQPSDSCQQQYTFT